MDNQTNKCNKCQESFWAHQILKFVYCQERIWANRRLNWKLSIFHQRQLASIVELYVPHIWTALIFLWSHVHFVEIYVQHASCAMCSFMLYHTYAMYIIPHIFELFYYIGELCPHFHIFTLLFSADGYVFVWWIEHDSVMARKSFSKVSYLPFFDAAQCFFLLDQQQLTHSLLNYHSSVKGIILHPAQIIQNITCSRLCLPDVQNIHTLFSIQNSPTAPKISSFSR